MDSLALLTAQRPLGFSILEHAQKGTRKGGGIREGSRGMALTEESRVSAENGGERVEFLEHLELVVEVVDVDALLEHGNDAVTAEADGLDLRAELKLGNAGRLEIIPNNTGEG